MSLRILGCFTAGMLLPAYRAFAVARTLSGITNHYRFDGGNGITAIDSVGGNHATLQNFGAGNAQLISGMFGGALTFTNENAYAITTSPISSNVFTVSFWSRLKGNTTSNDSVLLTPQGDNWITYNRSGGKGVGIGTVCDAQQPL